MMKHTLPGFLLASLVLGLAAGLTALAQARQPVKSAGQKQKASSKTAPVKRVPRPVPFAPGETLTYDISWSSYLTAGTATLSVKARRPSYGSEAYYIVAEGQPTPLLSKLYDVYYKADSLLDVYTLLPQRGSIFSKEGRRQRMKTTMFDHAAKKAHFEVQTQTSVKKDVAISAGTQDALGAVYVLRTMELKAGRRFSIPVCNDGESFNVQVAVGEVENVKTGIGTVRAWKITPTVPASEGARRLTVWLGDDARRLPVRMEAQLAVGSFDLTLRRSNR